MRKTELRIVPTVAAFALEQLLWSRRTLAMGLLALSPVALALVHRALAALALTSTPGFDAFTAIFSTVGFPFVAPVLALFYASGVVSDAVEAGTMPYFVTRPLSRSAVLLGQMLSSLVMLLLLFVPSLVVSFYVCLAPGGLAELGARFPSLATHVLAAGLGLLAYNGLFALAGTALRRPLLPGLFFVFGWQAIASFVPGTARYLTVAYYVQALVAPPDLGGAVASPTADGASAGAAGLALLWIAASTHGLALALFARRDVL